MTSPDAYHNAVRDVELILYVGCLPTRRQSDDFELDVVQPVVGGTSAILNAAAQTPTVKRLVLMSSSLVLGTFSEIVLEESPILFTADSRTPTPSGPYDHPFQASVASKVAAYNNTLAFMATQNPHFDLVITMPAFAIGRHELVTRPEEILQGTNGIALMPVLGLTSSTPMVSNSALVDDIAMVHTLALDRTRVPAGARLIIKNGGDQPTIWDEANEIVRRMYPGRVADGTLPANGSTPMKRLRISGEETERLLDVRFQDYEAQVRSVVEHYLELVDSIGGSENVGPFVVP